MSSSDSLSFSLSCPSVHFPTGTRSSASRIIPVFLPFHGCPGQCVYCAQDKQTGIPRNYTLQTILNQTRQVLEHLPPASQNLPYELAFYGGTFTSLPAKEQQLCLDFLTDVYSRGMIQKARCSTRPDAVSSEILRKLSEYPIHLIELGIQSFSDHVLTQSCRGYTSRQALIGCMDVLKAGFNLGIQLLPGLPGCTSNIFLQDAEVAISLHPSCIRYYPCLVPKNTVLAKRFLNGEYQPWSLEKTVSTLGAALAKAWKANIPVIRLSVAPESSFDAIILAGPRHPALGALIQAEALLVSVQEALCRIDHTPKGIKLPKHTQGFIFGNKGTLKKKWQSLGFYPEYIFFERRNDGEIF